MLKASATPSSPPSSPTHREKRIPTSSRVGMPSQPTTARTNSTGNNAAANHAQATKFAQCMRDNGVSRFPDPDASGPLTIEDVVNGSSVDPSSATFQQALSACRDLEPAVFMGQKRSAQQQEAALKFAQCIRDNGVKDFPDPAPDGPLVDTNRIPSAATPGGMSTLNAAMHKCRDFVAADRDLLTGWPTVS